MTENERQQDRAQDLAGEAVDAAFLSLASNLDAERTCDLGGWWAMEEEEAYDEIRQTLTGVAYRTIHWVRECAQEAAKEDESKRKALMSLRDAYTTIYGLWDGDVENAVEAATLAEIWDGMRALGAKEPPMPLPGSEACAAMARERDEKFQRDAWDAVTHHLDSTGEYLTDSLGRRWSLGTSPSGGVYWYCHHRNVNQFVYATWGWDEPMSLVCVSIQTGDEDPAPHSIEEPEVHFNGNLKRDVLVYKAAVSIVINRAMKDGLVRNRP